MLPLAHLEEGRLDQLGVRGPLQVSGDGGMQVHLAATGLSQLLQPRGDPGIGMHSLHADVLSGDEDVRVEHVMSVARLAKESR